MLVPGCAFRGNISTRFAALFCLGFLLTWPACCRLVCRGFGRLLGQGQNHDFHLVSGECLYSQAYSNIYIYVYYYIIWYYVILTYITLYNVILFYIILQYISFLFYIILHYIMLFYSILYYIHYIIFYSIIFYCIIFYSILLYYIMLYYIIYIIYIYILYKITKSHRVGFLVKSIWLEQKWDPWGWDTIWGFPKSTGLPQDGMVMEKPHPNGFRMDLVGPYDALETDSFPWNWYFFRFFHHPKECHEM